MKRSWWIAIGVLALLALVCLGMSSSREGFSVPTTIDPRSPIPDSEIDAVISNLPADYEATSKAESEAEQNALDATATGSVNGQAVSVRAASTPSPPMSSEQQRQITRMNVGATLLFFKMYLNKKGKTGDNVTIETADIDGFIASPGQRSPKATRIILESLKTAHTGIGTAVASHYADALAAVGQTAGYTTAPTGAASGSSAAASSAPTGAASGSSAAASSAPAGGAPPGSGGTATTTGTTTGGSSTSSAGPNNLLPTTSKLGGRNVFGPLFTSLGEINGAQGGDSSKTNTYPTLLGPNPKPSTRIEGAGVVNPSKNYTLANDGSLPSSAQTGSDEDSRFLPTSRVPGDMDIVDPYRTSQSFQASSYSLRNEPVPFLTDFSAFQR
jgi:hypothetical protein